MKVVLASDPHEMSAFAARFIARRIREAARPVLGLATGDTVLGTYAELRRMHRDEGLDFSACTTFNLDEYVGLAPSHPQSYHATMEATFFRHVNVDRTRTFLPNGCAPDLLVEASRYEDAIRLAGGVTVQLLGIGSNGHVAFNEPGSSLRSRTRVKRLSEQTIRDNARFFASPAEVPRYVLTMGVGTIGEARFLLLLASGERKAEAVRAALEGPLTALCPASMVQLHPHAFVVVDRAAASRLAGSYDTVTEAEADPFEEFLS
jgi:glucosamine-6-phosphate deaminase